jgi:Tfp pilus assembly protein PilF
MTPDAQPKRIYSPFHYDEAFLLRLSPPLWLVIVFGLRHIVMVVLALVQPGISSHSFWQEFQSNNIFYASNILVALVFIAAGHRVATAHDWWRRLWLHGRHLLLLAYFIDLVLFLVLHGRVLLDPRGYDFAPALAIGVADVFAMIYLLQSTLVRDIFSDFPAPPVVGSEKPTLSVREKLPSLDTTSPVVSSAQLLHEEGLQAAEAGQDAKAVDLIRQAIALEPTNAAFQFHAAELCRLLKRFEEAEVFGIECARLAPGNAEAHYTLGLILIEVQRPAEAIACFRSALIANGQHVAALNNLGVLLYEKGDDAGALQAFEQVLAIEPEHPDAKDNRNAILSAARPVAQPVVFPVHGIG